MATIEQITDKRGRRYVIKDDNGEVITCPSVTTILGSLPKGGLDWWGAKLALQAVLHLQERYGQIPDGIDALYEAYKQTEFAPHRALKKAGSRGTDVHNVAEKLLTDGKLEDLPRGSSAGEGYVDALVKWHDDYDVASWEPVAIEALLFSEAHLYAGQCDGILRRPDGRYLVVDFKTSKAIYESHLIQLAAYEGAAREMGLIPEGATVEKLAVRLGEDGSYEVVRSVHTVEDFLKVKAVHELLKNKERKGVKL